MLCIEICVLHVLISICLLQFTCINSCMGWRYFNIIIVFPSHHYYKQMYLIFITWFDALPYFPRYLSLSLLNHNKNIVWLYIFRICSCYYYIPYRQLYFIRIQIKAVNMQIVTLYYIIIYTTRLLKAFSKF